MRRKVLIGAWAAVALAAAAGVIWFYAAGNVGDPTEVTAPPITAAPDPDQAADSQAPETTAVGDRTTTASAASDEPGQAEAEAAPEASDEVGDTVELQLAEGTEARFLIYEDLRGEPFTVVGTTTEVVGRIEVDRADPASSQMGDILINARTFATDSSNRDRAIRGPILGAEQFEFITFRPLAIDGLTEAAEPGGEWDFTVEGDLTVRDVTRPVTFEVTAAWEEGDRLVGRASATVLRSEFGLTVPSVPFVANVGDEIGLELDFIARPGGLG